MTRKETLKRQAKRLRTHLVDRGHPLTHGQALEAVAASHGYRDWNTAAASDASPVAAQNTLPATPPGVGEAVSGTYLGIRFKATVVGLQALAPDRWKIAIQCDPPVQVSRFASMSILRRRLTAIIHDTGVSVTPAWRPTPMLVIDPK